MVCFFYGIIHRDEVSHDIRVMQKTCNTAKNRKKMEDKDLEKILWEDKSIADVRLSEKDRSEVLRYIGYSGQEMSEELEGKIAEVMDKTSDAATPRVIVASFDISDGWSESLKKIFIGEDIKKHLEGCKEVLLMGATLGSGVDRAIHIEEMRDPIASLIMDSSGSTLIEAVCDTFEANLRKQYQEQGKYLTTRFSPGYGDVPLAVQNDFGQVIEARRIGLTMTPEHIMIPRKSVTAIIGVADHPLKKRKKTCMDCNLHESCRFRKMGVVCGE